MLGTRYETESKCCFYSVIILLVDDSCTKMEVFSLTDAQEAARSASKDAHDDKEGNQSVCNAQSRDDFLWKGYGNYRTCKILVVVVFRLCKLYRTSVLKK